jgi:maleate isomerase
LLVLQADERIERDFRRLIPSEVNLLVSRIPSARDVSSDSLRAMEAHLKSSADLFPQSAPLDALGYACTSASAEIGSAQIAHHLRGVAQKITDPLSALASACKASNLERIALLSPYVSAVANRLREALTERGIDTVAMGSFHVREEARVVRLSSASVERAAEALAKDAPDAQAVFLSCTNLNTLDAIGPLERKIGKPVLSSNLVLAWDLLNLAGCLPHGTKPGDLLRRTR